MAATAAELVEKPVDLTSHTNTAQTVTNAADGTADASKVRARHETTVVTDPEDPLAVQIATPDNPSGQ